jgi:hypothetical protein
MLAEARDRITRHWWMCAFPGAAIALTVLAFNPPRRRPARRAGPEDVIEQRSLPCPIEPAIVCDRPE